MLLNLGSGRGEAPSSTRSRSVFNWRPSGKSTGCFKVRRVCQHGSRRLPGSLCLSCPRSWFLAFSGRGVWSLLPRDSAFPPPHPLPSPSFCLAAFLSHQVSFMVFERLHELLVDFKAAVRFCTYHFVVSVPVRDAFRPQSPTLPVVPFFFTSLRGLSSWIVLP